MHIFSPQVDWKIVEGGSLTPPFPFTLGFDIAGTVAATGCRGHCRLRVGDKVWADVGNKGLGAWAEYALADEAQTGLAPARLAAADAAVLPLVSLTSLQALRMMGLQPTAASNCSGLAVVVTSGSGGTGLTGVQLAKACGAAKVITACGPAAQDYCRSLGADVVVDYTKGKQALWDAAGADAVDAVYDNFGAPGTADLAMPSLRAGGVFLFLPGKGGALSKHPKAGVRQIDYGLTDSTRHEDLDALAAIAQAGRLRAHVSQSFALDDAVAALAASAAGKVDGKIGVTIS